MATHSFSAEEANKKAEDLVNLIGQVGFDVKDLNIVNEEGKAVLTGDLGDEETREKVMAMAENVFGAGTIDDKMSVGGVKTYTVVAGDTLGKIAKEFYGNPMKYKEIFEANTHILKNPDTISVGQVLNIPSL